MSFKQNIIHKLNNNQRCSFSPRSSIPPCVCVRVSRPHNVCLSLSECRLRIWQHTLQVRKHTHAERAVLLHSNVYLLEHFRGGILLSVNWQLGSILQGKAHWTAASFPDWLIGNDSKGKISKLLGCYCTKIRFYQSRKTFIMTKYIHNNPFNSVLEYIWVTG